LNQNEEEELSKIAIRKQICQFSAIRSDAGQEVNIQLLGDLIKSMPNI
jgi:hypothetical protein